MINNNCAISYVYIKDKEEGVVNCYFISEINKDKQLQRIKKESKIKLNALKWINLNKIIMDFYGINQNILTKHLKFIKDCLNKYGLTKILEREYDLLEIKTCKDKE